MDNNNIYQGLIQTKKKQTDYKDAESKQGYSDSCWETTWSITKCNESKQHFLIPGNDEIVQHISLINISGPKEIFALWMKEDEFKYAHNKSCVI